MSSRPKRRGEDLHPPKRRRRLNKDGASEARSSSTADLSCLSSEPPRAGLKTLQDLLKKYAQDTMAGAQTVVRGAGLLCDEAKREAKALKRDIVLLRACINELLDGAIVLDPQEPSMRLLSTARSFCVARKRVERESAAALSEVKAALERERSTRLQAQLEARAYRAVSTSTSKELEAARRDTAAGELRHHKASASSALAELKIEKTMRERQAQASAAAVRTAELAVEKERAKREAAEDGARCVICLSHSRNTMLLPCTHLVLCDKCPRVSSCPICRSRVRTTMPVILS